MGTRNGTHRVVVAGAGYAGMAAAVQLGARLKRRGDVRVAVVNPQERFTERMRLHMTATSRRLAETDIPELLAGTGVRFERGWVTALDADARTLRATRLATLHSGPVIVCGSGLTGVESAAEITERYPRLDVVLVGRTEPGASMSPKAGAYLRAALARLGVQGAQRGRGGEGASRRGRTGRRGEPRRSGGAVDERHAGVTAAGRRRADRR